MWFCIHPCSSPVADQDRGPFWCRSTCTEKSRTALVHTFLLFTEERFWNCRNQKKFPQVALLRFAPPQMALQNGNFQQNGKSPPPTRNPPPITGCFPDLFSQSSLLPFLLFPWKENQSCVAPPFVFTFAFFWHFFAVWYHSEHFRDSGGRKCEK